MSFELTVDQQALRELAGEFARREILPVAGEYDQEARFPRRVFEQALNVGLLSLNIPERYGGAGLGTFDLVLVVEQLAWACTGITAAVTLNALIADAILLGGDEEQRQHYLERLNEGQLGAYAVTEPGAGSDVAGLETRATRRGNGYVLNGTKTWISNATEAAFFVVFAKTDVTAGHGGLSAFVIGRETAGLEVGRPLGKMGQKAAPAAELFLTDVTIPAQSRLLDEGDGFKLAMQVFDRSRPMVAAFGVGLTQRCLDESLAYAQERHSMGQPIIRHQAIGHKIAEMGLRLEAARLLTYQAARIVDDGRRNTLEAAYAKAYAADTAMWAATEAVQIFGGMGYSTEYPAEKLLRDAKLLQIYEGTSEIQRNIMVRELLARRRAV
ncbi:MAG TPA: acyl-CoA dehydrogenase family protein [Anaerolineae bacterium]|jgi:acyl-CoA dehydrogenase|nr:acyl-CoA dehydrogenase family protein [Anaerolineae bacterium]